MGRGSGQDSRVPAITQIQPAHVAFLSLAQTVSKQPQARGEFLQGGEVASGTATIILFTGKRVSEWPNLLAVQDLYEIYEAQEKKIH